MNDKTRVLFVCHGNICRSPLAEAVFRRLAADAGVANRFEIDSAGISGYHEGESPDPRSHAEAKRRGIILEHSARRMRRRDADDFDIVLVMDRENLAAVPRGRAETALLRSFDRTSDDGQEVPDPYYGGADGFAVVHDMVERACRGLLEHLMRQQAGSDPTSGSARADA
ncbi:MAG TPA: low molecular weight protein-tyrosine-phosphatase [Longimicrobiales bacterium]